MQCYQNIVTGDDRFVPFPSPTSGSARYDPIRDPRVMTKYRLAFGLLIQLGRVPQAAAAFRRLPYGFDFFDLLRHRRIWYYCDMTRITGALSGASVTPGLPAYNWWEGAPPPRPSLNDVTAQITVTAVRINEGYRPVAGTLLHELAHVNGASGSPFDNSAERILIPFGLGDVFDPDVFGAVSPREGGTAVA